MAAHVLCGRVHDDIGTLQEWVLQGWWRECRVDTHVATSLVCLSKYISRIRRVAKSDPLTLFA